MAMLQVFAKALPQPIEMGMRRQFLGLVPQFRSVSLSKVVVTAEGDEATGDFRPVGGIGQKLRKLSEIKKDELAGCVVAWDQDIPGEFLEPRDAQIDRHYSNVRLDWLRGRGHRAAIVRAHDAVDACCRLWELQSRSTLGKLI
jgi:hypothetical protein